jgi:hypothetical protein
VGGIRECFEEVREKLLVSLTFHILNSVKDEPFPKRDF